MRVLDFKVREKLPNYLFQCLLATISLVIMFVVEDAIARAAIVAAVASTVFIICLELLEPTKKL